MVAGSVFQRHDRSVLRHADGGGVYSSDMGDFDLAPDGRVLGVNLGTRFSARGFVVAANWGAEMRALEER